MLIIDGTFLIYKSYYRTKKIQESFEVVNESHFAKIARNMFLKMLSNIKNSFNPTQLFIVFDCEGLNFRHRILPTYKSNRKEKPEELIYIKNEVYDFLHMHKFCFQVAENVEGDDLIASYVHQNPNESIQIYTGDGDLGAVVNKNVTLLLEKSDKTKIKKVQEITIHNFHHFFNVPPSKMADFKALQGDKSDFLKGVDGLFRTQVIHLLMEYHSIEDFLLNGKEHQLYSKILATKDKILLNKKVATLIKDYKLDVNREYSFVKNIHIPSKVANKVGWDL